MPRKQRFKPSRKPKPVGTPTDVATLQAVESMRPPDSDGRDQRPLEESPPAMDAGSESG